MPPAASKTIRHVPIRCSSPLRLGVAGLAMLATPAAQAATPIVVDPPKIPAPAVQHVPLAVGLCLSPTLRTAVVTLEQKEVVLRPSDSTSESKAWSLGSATAATVTTTLRGMFDGLQILDSCPSDAGIAAGLKGTISAELEDVGVRSQRHLLDSRTQGHLGLRLTLHRADGGPDQTWPIVGLGVVDHASSRSGDEVAATLLAALRDASARILIAMSLSPEFHSWLESAGAGEDIGSDAHDPDVPQGGQEGARNGQLVILTSRLDADANGAIPCLRKKLQGLDAGVRIVAAEQVRDTLFPWLEPGALVLDSYQTVAFARRAIQERAREADVQFVLSPKYAGSSSEEAGHLMCGAAGEGIGCIGAELITDTSTLSVELWDLRRGVHVPSIDGQGHARIAVIGYILPIPIPLSRSSNAQACEETARTLLSALHGDSSMLKPLFVPASIQSSEEPSASDHPSLSNSDNAAPSAEDGQLFSSVHWFEKTDDLGKLGNKVYDIKLSADDRAGGVAGALRLTDQALVFRAYPDDMTHGNVFTVRIPYEDVSKVEYRTSRLAGSSFQDVSSVVLTRKGGQVDSLAIYGAWSPDAAPTQALAETIQSKLQQHAAGSTP